MEEMNLMNKSIQHHWSTIYPLLSIRNQREYDKAVERLNGLIDLIGTNQHHPLYGLLDTLGTLVHVYEEKHYSMPETTGVDALHFLMEEHGLTQSDLSEVGSQGVVSEILSGKRRLNLRQIRLLAKRFGVSPAVFV